MATLSRARKRTGRKPDPKLTQPDFPYTMKLPDGRTLLVEIPGRWMAQDKVYGPVFRPEAVRFLDRIRALAVPLSASKRAPTPGYITALREGLGLTQEGMGQRLGVDKMTVSRWERGTRRPSAAALEALDFLRRDSLRKGVLLPG